MPTKDSRKVVATVSLTVPNSTKKRELRNYIKSVLDINSPPAYLPAIVSGVRVNFESWGGETIIKGTKAPKRAKKTTLQAGKAKGKGKGKGGAKKPAKPVKKAAKRTYTRRSKAATKALNGSGPETIEVYTEL